MKCWECKREITKAARVSYIDEYREQVRYRDVCEDCYKLLTLDPCHNAIVSKITQGQLKGRRKMMQAREAAKEVTKCIC